MAVVLVLLLVVFAGLVRATAAMVLGPADERSRPRRGATGAGGPVAPLVLALAVTAVVGFSAVPVGTAIARAVAVVVG